MSEVFIGLGGNLGDRCATLAHALDRITELPGTRLLAVSGAVESEPWGGVEQPPFANAVARLETALSAPALLAELKRIERALGRTSGVRYGPRPVDLDILLFGDEVWHTDQLTVPHPRLAERQFALLPLLEIAPGASGPGGAPFDPAAATEGRIIARLGTLPGYEQDTVGVPAD